MIHLTNCINAYSDYNQLNAHSFFFSSAISCSPDRTHPLACFSCHRYYFIAATPGTDNETIMAAHINDLPTEVLRTIFLLLEPPAFLRVSQTCTHWRRLAHWNYVLLWHIDSQLTDADNEISIFRLYSKVCLKSSGNDNGKKSEVLNHYLDSLNEAKDVATANQTPPVVTPTNPFTNSMDMQKLKHFSISKIYELSAQHSESRADDLKPDQSLVLFYHKLLQLKLVGVTLQPLFRIVATSTSFFPNHLVEDQQTTQYVDECTTFSPEGTFLLSIKRNKDNDHFLSITVLDDGTSNNTIPYLKAVYRWKNDRRVSDVVMSRDFHYIAVSYHVGYVEVHNLGTSPTSVFKSEPLPEFPVNINGKESFAYSTKCLFQSQYPSLINYLAVSANCEILFLRSQRLGGLFLVNLLTGDIIDIPHYRMDLAMGLDYQDKVLMISGWHETIIFGKATKSPPKKLPKQGTLWDYYTSLIQNHISSTIPVEKAMALQKQDAYLGFDFSQPDSVSVKIIIDDDELLGFTSLEQIEEEEEQEEQAEQEQNDPEKQSSSPASAETDLYAGSADGAANQAEVVSPVSSVGDEDANENDDGDDDDDDDDPDGADSDLRSCSLLTHEGITRKNLTYCLSPNGLLFAIALHDKIYMYVLREANIDDALVTGVLPYRHFRIDLFKNIGSGRLSFVGNNKLLAITQDRIVMYELANNAKWTRSGQRLFQYLKVNADSNVEVI